MTKSAAQAQRTFPARAIITLRENLGQGWTRATDWHRGCSRWARDNLEAVYDWFKEYSVGVIVLIAVVIWIGLQVWFWVEVALGKVEGSAAQVGVGAFIGSAILGAIASCLAAGLAFVVILLLNRLFVLLAPVVLFLPVILWTPVYAFWQALIVLCKLLLLVPLAALFIATRAVQLWRGIFYSCPSRTCAYRGLPDYVCPKCGTGNPKLWPNLYGLLWHPCIKCDCRLPTLDFLGRKDLRRLCGAENCHIPLLGKHAGKAPERLVGIVGGPSSGKTCYLLMAVRQILDGAGGNPSPLRGEIDDPEQEKLFRRQWKELRQGRAVAKTVEVARAFLLYLRLGRWKRCQLYLYDAPGEEFESISSMSKQQYFPLLEGFVLLVDPMSFEAVGGAAARRTMSLRHVVSTTLGSALAGMQPGADGKVDVRVAVVISKADLPVVREKIGDVRERPIRGDVCREAIAAWGGENVLRALRTRFRSVEYFACSPLGREADRRCPDPFQGSGLLEPLLWILHGGGK